MLAHVDVWIVTALLGALGGLELACGRLVGRRGRDELLVDLLSLGQFALHRTLLFLWDTLFGTAYFPREQSPDRYGLSSDFSEPWQVQLWAPLVRAGKRGRRTTHAPEPQ